MTLGVAAQTETRLGDYVFLPRCPRDFTEGHASVDRRATIGLRVDGKQPNHQLQPLRHADKAKPRGFHCPFVVKTGSRIAHGEIDRTRSVAQFHIEVPNPAMLHRIVQSFLQDAEKAK